MGGFALVNMLLTAHPSSFSSFSGVNYIAYAIVGGRGSLLGAVVGSGLLVWISNLFSSQGQYSAGLACDHPGRHACPGDLSAPGAAAAQLAPTRRASDGRLPSAKRV
jgi:ABC-type branched-subunit amino acid transport system permease subunit